MKQRSAFDPALLPLGRFHLAITRDLGRLPSHVICILLYYYP